MTTRWFTLARVFLVGLLLLGLAFPFVSMVKAGTTAESLQVMHHFGGLERAIAASGHYVYVGVGPRMLILDASNPARPTQVGQTPVLPDLVEAIAVAGDYAYLAVGEAGLRIIDVSDPDDYLYAANPDGLHVVDTSDPYTLNETSSYAFDVPFLGTSGLFVTGGQAYVIGMVYGEGRYPAVMRIFDVSNPAAPIQVASYADLPDAGDIFVEGDYAYIAAGSQGLLVWDISDPTTATQVAAYATVAPAHDLHVVDNHVYVTFHERGEDLVGLEIVDVTDPRAPEQAGLYLLSDWVERTRWGEAYIDVYVASGYAYLAWYHICLPACDGGLRIVDVSDPAAPADVAFYNLGRAVARSVFRVGASVYLSGGGTGLYVFRFAPPTSATIGPDGGSLTSPIDDTTYTFPAGAFSDSVTVTHTILQPSEVPPTGPWMTVGHIFRVEAMYDDTGEAAEPAQPYTVTVVYKDAERGPAIETSLALYYWDSDSVQWVAEPTSEVNSESNTVTATPDHLRLWALLGGTHRFYLPLLFHVE